MRAAVDEEPLVVVQPPSIVPQREDRDHEVQRLTEREHPVQRQRDPPNEEHFGHGEAQQLRVPAQAVSLGDVLLNALHEAALEHQDIRCDAPNVVAAPQPKHLQRHHEEHRAYSAADSLRKHHRETDRHSEQQAVERVLGAEAVNPRDGVLRRQPDHRVQRLGFVLVADVEEDRGGETAHDFEEQQHAQSERGGQDADRRRDCDGGFEWMGVGE